VRVLDSARRLASKQLTLCYCDSAEEAAVARDLATLWNWHHLGGQEHGGQQRLNFSLARWVQGLWLGWIGAMMVLLSVTSDLLSLFVCW